MTRTLAAMEFRISEPDIVIDVGDKQVRMYFTPCIYVRLPDGQTHTFESRIKADLFFAEQVRTLRYWHGFDKLVDRQPEPTDPDERRGWRFALQCEADSQEIAETTAHQERIRHGAW